MPPGADRRRLRIGRPVIYARRDDRRDGRLADSGAAVAAEASNFEIPIPPPAITGHQRPPVVVSRPDPLYTARELSALVQAIDIALRTSGDLPSN